jgi:hypothetical protein
MYFAFANCMRAVSSALNKRLLLRMTTIASGLACFEISVDKYVRLPGRLEIGMLRFAASSLTQR